MIMRLGKVGIPPRKKKTMTTTKKMTDKEWLASEKEKNNKAVVNKLNAKGKISAKVAPVKPLAKVMGKGKK